ncbi:NeuD/PglB/VioB family sugar acetyltransferase [Microbacterium sp. zg.B48]|uniref:NeuD/PglB/VioB family sugar acetyltransferase n=1 Tax=unclassified Microbacterium TaxID=2609290 RepID=UPI00214B8144|nr:MULTISPECIES: NeuD/PglB/VioB family sugar acetyltransferase [unclassified Microbacterium]MCR2764205.1 NeuD/PglB/VioB family sugar acetyltransferase [Microbacterium sp. zg.B48]MCR2808928.1 NeuD/PglB/VioB family sugar acetyltransferase [Microbacterium sp. zg.B185]WIM18654.1 NeuD/PglB/VioB family sugar acetyltransferase [Microbacterium sp. zg-B185]
MSEGVLLVGASGLAREVLAAGIVGVTGILDDNLELQGTEIAGVPVIGLTGDATRRDEMLLVCIGPSVSRRTVVRRLRKFGVPEQRFATYVARSARIGASSAVGAGSIVLDGAVVTADAVLGRHVVVMPNCTIAHDNVVEDFATLAAGVALGGSVCIREAAYLGMNASIRQGVQIGAAATVGMGAAVLEDVPSDQIWAGVPARRLEEAR